MKKIVGLIVVLVSLLSGCNKKEEDVLVVLTSSGYEPYEMVDTDGNLIGFDIELMQALADEAGVVIEFKDVNFDGIVGSLQSNAYEIAIAGITPTAERDEVIDFGNVYYNSVEGLENVIIFEDSISSIADLEGKVVAAQLGTIQAELLAELSLEYNFTVTLRQSNSQIVEEIKLGTIDAMVVEQVVSLSILDVNETLSSISLDVDTNSSYGNAIAFATDSVYISIFNDALDTLIENGTLDTLINKWFTE
jgi:polar amino acid transport system substrate-binding protein